MNGVRHWFVIKAVDFNGDRDDLFLYHDGAGLDHVIVWNERSLRRSLKQYVACYHAFRTHLSLDKDAPVRRPVQPSAAGTIVQVPHVGGLHQYSERRAA